MPAIRAVRRSLKFIYKNLHVELEIIFHDLRMSITRQNVWQQVLAQDALYNNYRFPNKRDHQNRNLYLRRRSQLSREYFQNKSFINQDPLIRYNYCIIRKQLLCNRYGPIISSGSEAGSNSLRSKSRTPSLPSLFRQMDLDLSDGSSPISGNKSSFITRISEVVPTKIALASRALAGNDSVEEGYAFTGIKHIFDHCSVAVNRIRFAHNNASRLAIGCEDGSLSICCTWPFQEERVLSIMSGQHKSGITDLAWSSANDFILTASRDSTVCLWNVESSSLARIYSSKELSNAARSILTVEFQPMNNNLFVAGGAEGVIQVVNLSTGKPIKSGRDKLGGQITSLTFEEATGECLWAGTSLGVIQSFVFEVGTGRISRAKRLTVSTSPCAVSSLQARAWVNREARDPCLLANCANNSLLFFRIVSRDGQLVLKNRFPTRHLRKSIRSCFCPLISFRQGACVVTGSEDGNVLVFDVTALATGAGTGGKQCINVLQGHTGAVLDVAVSCDELVLASCDDKGTVILWRRVNDDEPNQRHDADAVGDSDFRTVEHGRPNNNDIANNIEH